MNQPLMEKERSIINDVGITQEFWPEAVDTAKYLVNRSPSSMLVNSTPHEVWFSKNPFLSHTDSLDVMHL
jgi:hypothetical protein